MNLNVFVRVGAHLVFLPIYAQLRQTYASYRNASMAASIGAEQIPHVVGKWPGNIDILLRLIKGMKEDYVLQAHADLFEEYGCNTLNTRILWSDQVHEDR